MKLWSILTIILFAFLMLAIAASGALPPLPVPRPAVLESPRAASQLKSAPMLKVVTFAPASQPAPVSWMEITPGLNLSGCDTNDPNCRLWFMQHYSTDHPAGYDLTVTFRDTVNGDGPRIAFFGAGTFDRISEFNWPQQEPQPQQRYFKRILTIPIVPTSRTSTPVMWFNTSLGVTGGSRKK